MNHYDGPAFYRKFVHDSTINKHDKLRAMRRRKLQYAHRSNGVTGFSKAVQRADFGNFKPVKTSSSHIDLQNNPIARITASFKPRRHYGIPDRSVEKTSQTTTEFERINDHYHRLTSELAPSDNEVTLMASSDAVNTRSVPQREGSLHFKLAPDSGSVQGDRQHSPVFSRITASDSGDVDLFRQSSESSADSVVRPSAVQSASSEGSLSRRVDRSRSASASNHSATHEDSLSHRDNKESESKDYVVTPVSSSSESSLDHRTDQSSTGKPSSRTSYESSEPLGHDFSSIMHDEGEDVRNNLALFNQSNSGSGSKVKADESPASSAGFVSVGSTDQSSRNDASISPDVPTSSKNDSSEGSSIHQATDQRPDFVAQNPTNVQPSSDFTDSDSDSDEQHHNIQPSTVTNYRFPSHDLLVAPKHYDDQGLDDWILNKASILNKTLRAFHVSAQVVDWTNGPTVTQFQVKLRLGVKVSKINHLSDDLKMALAAKDIRIQAPIPGKTTCGIEIPNPKPRPVMLSEVVNSKTFKASKSDLTIALGVDLTGKPRVTDLRKMPHGLIAGATGSGKSVFINCMLVSLMYKATPQELKMILIDPKAVEFAPYNGIPYLLSPVISEPKQAAASLKWATKEMNQRYEKLAAAGVRNIEQFNQKAEQTHQPQMKMPYILIVIDELADLMMVAGDEIETYIVRITQKARAAGIHLVVATQRPSVDVITGTMKNNIPTRVAFMVSSQVDSRTIIDQSGAERLLGKGDMLYLGNGSSHPIRLQGCFVSNQEIDKVAGFARRQEPAHYAFHPGSLLKHVSRLENQDKLMPQVLAYIAKEKTVSTSKLQRVFSIGYNRSAKIIDDLEQHGYISGQEGSKPRDVYLTEKDYKKLNL